jgi:hypothetical protein
MSLEITPESTPTRIVRDPSLPQSTRPGQEVNRIWPRPEHAVASGWTIDIPVSQSPPEKALLDVVMTFMGGNLVRMEAVNSGVRVEGRGAPNVYVRLKDAVRKYLEASGNEGAELLNYDSDTWFRFVSPNQTHRKTLTERFNEAYDEEAKQEDEEFVRNLKRYHRRRFSDEW